MNQPADWVPMLWPSGPLEIYRRQGREQIPPDIRQTLMAWHESSSLYILHGTPVNCLIVTWAAGLEQDSEQQRSLEPLVSQARDMNLDVIGWISRQADSIQAAAAARKAGLAAVICEGRPPGNSGLPVLPVSKEEEIAWDSPSGVAVVTGRPWPRVRTQEGTSDASAGPTGRPWVDANGWLILLARAMAPQKTLWLSHDVSREKNLRPDFYHLADAEAYGGHWVISLSDAHRGALLRRQPEAEKDWSRLIAAVRFFHEHRDWRAFLPDAPLGVVSEFAGTSAFLATEILNLATRDQQMYRVIRRSRLQDAPLDSLHSVLYVDPDLPSPAVSRKLIRFAENGGVLIVPGTWKDLPGAVEAEDRHPRFVIRRVGKGKLAVATEEWQDPYAVAADVHLLTSRRYDPFRLWNAGSLIGHCAASPDERKRIVHLLNFSAREAASEITLAITRKVRSARLWQLESQAPISLEMREERTGMELYLPPLAVYAAVEFEV